MFKRIIEKNGYFYYSKFDPFTGWRYADKDDLTTGKSIHWWLDTCSYARFNTKEALERSILKYKKKVEKKKKIVIHPLPKAAKGEDRWEKFVNWLFGKNKS